MHSVSLKFGLPVPLSVLSGTAPLLLPLAGVSVRAGFPSPADDYLCKRIDLNEILITHLQSAEECRS